MGEAAVEIVEIGGQQREVVRLRNGTLQDAQTGKFLTPPSPEHAPITQANASTIANIRWEKARAKAVEGMLMAGDALNLGAASGEDVWAHVIKARTINAINATDRSGTEDARFISQAVDYMPDRRNSSAAPPGAGATVTLSPDAAMRLVEIFAAKLGGDE